MTHPVKTKYDTEACSFSKINYFNHFTSEVYFKNINYIFLL